MSAYQPTIGLEIHAELRTQTKMFCNSKNDPDEKRPNVNICPICMAHPGTLPSINREAVKHILKIGIALGGEIADFTEFDRKNYFYPDIPKGYQISQYKYPLVKGGELCGVSITRVHLEEDTARSLHQGEYSLIDFNRAGVPLMELVTEPVIRSASDAARFAKELQILLRTLKAGEANMEKGEMRVEANVSVSREEGKFGTKVEIKNLNSFRSVERAIEYEVKRQTAILEKGEKVIQETRGWDEAKGETFSQRLKEESHDYRYFPDPDLPKLYLSEIPEFSRDALRKEMPELPNQKRDRLSKFGLKADGIEMLVGDEEMSAFFDETAKLLQGDSSALQLAANYLTSDIAGLLAREGKTLSSLPITPEAFAELMRMTQKGDVSSRGAKDVLAALCLEGGDPRRVAESRGLLQKHDEEELRQIVKTVAKQNQSVVNDYRSGKEAALKFLIGQGMKESKGSANPKILEKLFREELHETS